MEKDRKLKILDDLIDRITKGTYNSPSDMNRCVYDVKSFYGYRDHAC
jgi:hypothetical protein